MKIIGVLNYDEKIENRGKHVDSEGWFRERKLEGEGVWGEEEGTRLIAANC